MKHEKSCGVIPFCSKDNNIFFLLIKQNNGIVGFPKGHVEKEETEKETALRECLEETNLKVDFVGDFREEISYFMEEFNSFKTVVFFLGRIDNFDYKKQETEISDISILSYEEALEHISFNDTKQLLVKAYRYISNLLLK